jgi:glycosyltransferase involved in cell wall biosynthesis
MPKASPKAVAAGCSVATTDVKRCRDAILPEVTADLVEVRNSQMRADVLLALIEGPKRREAYGAAGQEMAGQRFSTEVVASKTTKYLQRAYGKCLKFQQTKDSFCLN